MPNEVHNPNPDAPGTILIIPAKRHQGLDIHSLALLGKLARKYADLYNSEPRERFWRRVLPLFDWLSAEKHKNVTLSGVLGTLIQEYQAGCRFYSNYSNDHRRRPRYALDRDLDALVAAINSESQHGHGRGTRVNHRGRSSLPTLLNNHRRGASFGREMEQQTEHIAICTALTMEHFSLIAMSYLDLVDTGELPDSTRFWTKLQAIASPKLPTPQLTAQDLRRVIRAYHKIGLDNDTLELAGSFTNFQVKPMIELSAILDTQSDAERAAKRRRLTHSKDNIGPIVAAASTPATNTRILEKARQELSADLEDNAVINSALKIMSTELRRNATLTGKLSKLSSLLSERTQGNNYSRSSFIVPDMNGAWLLDQLVISPRSSVAMQQEQIQRIENLDRDPLSTLPSNVQITPERDQSKGPATRLGSAPSMLYSKINKYPELESTPIDELQSADTCHSPDTRSSQRRSERQSSPNAIDLSHYYCHLCECSFEYYTVFIQHTKSAEHSQALAKTRQPPYESPYQDPSNTQYHCKPCASTFNRLDNYQQHTRSLKHQHAVGTKPQSTPKQQPSTSHTDPTSPFYCDVCQSGFKAKPNFIQHTQTLKHRQAVSEVVKAQQKGPPLFVWKPPVLSTQGKVSYDTPKETPSGLATSNVVDLRVGSSASTVNTSETESLNGSESTPHN